MLFTTWFSFMIISWLTSISPGPGAIQAMSYGLINGWYKTILIIIGQEVALSLIMITIGAGAGIILKSIYIMMIIRGLGSAWLIYNGYLTYCLSKISLKINNKNSNKSLNKIKRFLIGFITTITNVRVIILMISLIPQFINPNKGLIYQLIILITTMIFIDGFMMNVYAFSASRIQYLINSPKTNKIQHCLFGGALIFSGIMLILPF